VYCVASGALSVYMSCNILALFAPSAYTTPLRSDGVENSPDKPTIDLGPHLTNTCLQTDVPDPNQNVRLLSEMVGCPVYSGSKRSFSGEDLENITKQVEGVLAETFQAAIASPVHFQVKHHSSLIISHSNCIAPVLAPAKRIRSVRRRFPCL
jgi:tubulin--tyrosine ligase